ncbi:ACP S-malonyltransferase [Enterobacteriaceae endosymbiont of Donacia thalassina]|uniref:ACP S-malonyltransferase n=1 Tax=Enterobacteriaceae endosymbiont of Donacia thalassina TaxID=2675786 RepID=UPI001448CA3A|nr:ACP S-malonyltransferase [Enterobacteriaceae endosymbiont of Donacia thalassina]QJC37207.1 ACP S-malonyltransferase [Enterobacteriaceae endosymbiont of Donacia thalassina]
MGAYTIPININIPSHCLLMKSIAYKFKDFLDKITINKPKIKFINNVNCKYEKSSEKIKKNLVKQLYTTVNWFGCIKFIEKKNIFNVIEFTPKSILKKVSLQITNNININSIYNVKTFLLTLEKYKNLNK